MPVTLANRNRDVNEAFLRIIWVPIAKVMESGPDSVACWMNLSVISSIAWSQPMRSHLPEPRSPTRFMG